ncbi:mitochondrial trans-2-enoyl-CoA reductase (NADPH) [Andalucia godoyi]|uniref:enoyl-[acyl-carrier-protein] reductase n=1 Tax=Andalucia godoyi TaxID=505711 RepID=A0A8K0F4F6_ANDGO|nr:mitochondrial trans-2-enoyl-CoA reductase (NADPH) [Andalucia godoyi]|eukprot:ANDGO_01959.mRNA.1 mitochondrial trans-2-enoyl-CoA reductase (NADPH)
MLQFRSVFRRFASSQAIRFKEYGAPSVVLKRESIELPKSLGDSQVLVRMVAAPINPADLNAVQGNYGIKTSAFPATAGNEGVGIVEKVGSLVKTLKAGDVVIPTKPGLGTWAQHLVASADSLDALPFGKDFPVEYAATLSVNPCTAYRLLSDFASLSKGDVVIQNAANSTVGLSVIQIAKARGIRTINVVRNRPNYEQTVDALKALGADVVVHEEFFASHEMKKILAELPAAKVAFDAVGGPSATNLSRALGDNGSLVTYGGLGRQGVTIPTSSLIFKNISVKGFWMSRWYNSHSADDRRKMQSEVAEMVKKGQLKLALERVKFADFSAALEKSQTGFRGRKVLLTFE